LPQHNYTVHLSQVLRQDHDGLKNARTKTWHTFIAERKIALHARRGYIALFSRVDLDLRRTYNYLRNN
jgi:hypothetical protein